MSNVKYAGLTAAVALLLSTGLNIYMTKSANDLITRPTEVNPSVIQKNTDAIQPINGALLLLGLLLAGYFGYSLATKS